mmetsp:Transcript_1283/g.3120  ORF Transcript_1283/g.3120 Transcript_1283/m.3120 type:complete len:274 (+) Transcript_1283:456-1277(+)
MRHAGVCPAASPGPAKVASTRSCVFQRSSTMVPVTSCSTTVLLSSWPFHQRSKWLTAKLGLRPGTARHQAKATASERAATPARPRRPSTASCARLRLLKSGATPPSASSNVMRAWTAAMAVPGGLGAAEGSGGSVSCTSQLPVAWRASSPAPRTPSSSQAARAAKTTRRTNPPGGQPTSRKVSQARRRTPSGAPASAQDLATKTTTSSASSSAASTKGLNAGVTESSRRASPARAWRRSRAERDRSPSLAESSWAGPLAASRSTNGATTSPNG